MLCIRHGCKTAKTLSSLTNKFVPKTVQFNEIHLDSCRILQSSICCGVLSEKIFRFKESVLITPSCRWKSKNKTSKTREKDLVSDDEEEGTERAEEEDWTKGKDSKILTLGIASLRTDLVLKASLNMARNKVETLFYESKIRVNGKKLLKKSAQVHVGDEIDVLRGPSPDNPSQFILVTRIEVLSATERNAERLSVRVRRYPKLTIEDYVDESPVANKN